jgi:hypothetical protein
MSTPSKGGAKSLRSRQLAQIHIGATALQLIRTGDDSAYRQMLKTVARVDSAGKLDHAGRARVLAHLVACGWKQADTRKHKKVSPQVALIWRIWNALGAAGQLTDKSESALRHYVQTQSAPYHPDRVGYSAPELLPKAVAGRVIEHLKKWTARLEVEWR